MQHVTGAPPADGDARAAEYAATRGRVRELLAGASGGDAARTVPACPDWTVHDAVAHLAGVCADLAARRLPDGDTQAWVDRQVAERSDHSVAELLDEWDANGPTFEAAIRKSPVNMGGLLYDVVAHEHDLRGALGRPGDRDTDGVRLSNEIILGMVDADLRTNDLPAVTLCDGDTAWTVGEGEPELRVELSPWELMRFLGSRRTREQMLAVPAEGDTERFLPGLAHLPLPEHDLGEA